MKQMKNSAHTIRSQGPTKIEDRIIEAAAQLFIRDGYERASTAAIAKVAKTSKREIYNRFHGKEELFECVIHYLCTLAGPAEPQPAQPDHLETAMKAAAQAVIERFIQKQTRGILVAAIAAKPQFPAIIEIFWNEGPGLAVTSLTEAIKTANKKGGINVRQPKKAAHKFIIDCCGPIVTHQLFDSTYSPKQSEIDQHINETWAAFLLKHAR